MSKVVFVGNVPYNMGEEQLIDVFKSVGQVVGFRLVFDRDTGKPKGYGFCEFADHETAMSAVRNLNNTDVGGRPLRIDLADSDPFLEGKTTVRGEIIDGGIAGPSDRWRDGGRAGGGAGGDDRSRKDPNAFLSNLPPGVPVPPGQSVLDFISQTLATMNATSLMEVLAQMKAFVINHPEQAKVLLVAHPQLAYALFQGLVLNEIVDKSILERMAEASPSRSAAAAPTPSLPPAHLQQHMPPPPPQMPAFAPQHQPFPPPPIPQAAPTAGPRYPLPPPSMPPASAMFQHQPPPQQPPPPQVPSYYRSTPPAPSETPPATRTPQVAALSDMDDAQKNMLLQVLSMTQQQIDALAPTERSAIQQLRSQLGSSIPT